MSDLELVYAVIFHFPIHIQNSLAAVQITSLQGAVYILKRLEITESRRSNFTASHMMNYHQGRPHGRATTSIPIRKGKITACIIIIIKISDKFISKDRLGIRIEINIGVGLTGQPVVPNAQSFFRHGRN
jgi:hypothetical protein